MNHVHVIVEAEVKAEKAMTDFKAYANRGLNRLRLDATERMRWRTMGALGGYPAPRQSRQRFGMLSKNRVSGWRCLLGISRDIGDRLPNGRGS